MPIVNDTQHGLLLSNITRPLIDAAYTGGGTITRTFLNITGGVGVSLFIRSITGTVDVQVFTAGKGDRIEELSLISFPTFSAPTTSLVVRRSPNCLSMLRILVTFSDAVDMVLFVQNSKAVDINTSIREEVIMAPDSVVAITYADIGTLDERITSMAYTAASVPNTTVIKTITYTLASGTYVATGVAWT